MIRGDRLFYRYSSLYDNPYFLLMSIRSLNSIMSDNTVSYNW